MDGSVTVETDDGEWVVTAGDGVDIRAEDRPFDRALEFITEETLAELFGTLKWMGYTNTDIADIFDTSRQSVSNAIDRVGVIDPVA